MPPSRPRWEIYNKEMSRLDDGDALWNPTPLSYFERIQLGDVGYIRRGSFHLLFSAACPLEGRELGVDVPRTFKQLDVGQTFTIGPRQPGYLSTKSVRKTPGRPRASIYPLLEPGSSISFQLTGDQGAALLTKHQIHREDAQLEGTFREYTKGHYDSWVKFARERGHPNDIKPVLVTGVDMTRDFAMVVYSKDDDDMTAEFTISAPGIASPWGTWSTPGVVHTNCGPQLRRPPFDDTRSTEVDSDEPTQCVFVRYYTMRKRLGIPRVIRAAAGPHRLGPGSPDPDRGSPLEARSDSNSGPGAGSGSLDDDGDDRGAPVRAESEDEDVIHNATADERDDFDVVADYIFQNSDAESVLIHHQDITLFREPGGSVNVSTHLFGSQPPITVDRNGVAMIVHQTEGSAHIRYNSPPGITTFTPDAGDSTIPSTAWGGSPHHLADGYRPFAGPVGGWGSWIDPTGPATFAPPRIRPTRPSGLTDDCADEDNGDITSGSKGVTLTPPGSPLRTRDGVQRIPFSSATDFTRYPPPPPIHMGSGPHLAGAFHPNQPWTEGGNGQYGREWPSSFAAPPTSNVQSGMYPSDHRNQHTWSSQPPSYNLDPSHPGHSRSITPHNKHWQGGGEGRGGDGSSASDVPPSRSAQQRGSARDQHETGGKSTGEPPVGIRKCASCKVTQSPEWRKDPSGQKDLCNECGPRYARSRAKKEGGSGTMRRKYKALPTAAKQEGGTPQPPPRRVGVKEAEKGRTPGPLLMRSPPQIESRRIAPDPSIAIKREPGTPPLPAPAPILAASQVSRQFPATSDTQRFAIWHPPGMLTGVKKSALAPIIPKPPQVFNEDIEKSVEGIEWDSDFFDPSPPSGLLARAVSPRPRPGVQTHRAKRPSKEGGSVQFPSAYEEEVAKASPVMMHKFSSSSPPESFLRSTPVNGYSLAAFLAQLPEEAFDSAMEASIRRFHSITARADIQLTRNLCSIVGTANFGERRQALIDQHNQFMETSARSVLVDINISHDQQKGKQKQTVSAGGSSNIPVDGDKQKSSAQTLSHNSVEWRKAVVSDPKLAPLPSLSPSTTLTRPKVAHFPVEGLEERITLPTQQPKPPAPMEIGFPNLPEYLSEQYID